MPKCDHTVQKLASIFAGKLLTDICHGIKSHGSRVAEPAHNIITVFHAPTH